MAAMTLHRQLKKVGGSVAVLIPRDIAMAMGAVPGGDITMSLVGRQLVIEPEDDTVPEASFRRALAAVLRQRAPALSALARYDAKGVKPTRRKRK